jgi:XTP/dITP diphosphohydrolase
MKRIILASANRNKITEIQAILPPIFDLVPMQEAGITEDIPETGTTIQENSYLKADYVFKRVKTANGQIAVIADDSGLEVEALGGAPGVYSARYAGEMKNDAANNLRLLKELEKVTDRKARFVTGITLMLNNEVRYFEGMVPGTIAYQPRGSNGFGYDPLFIPTGFRSTFAELNADIKNSISHRADAVRKLAAFLRTLGHK